MAVTGYIRVSRVQGREGERFISPGEQRRAIEGWAKLHGRTVGSIFEDLDQSGKKRHRPGLDEAMAKVLAGESEGIIVAKLDRFGRSVAHLGELLDQLADNDAALFTVAERIDTSGRAGRMIASIMSAVAEFEVHRQGESWLVARTNAVERGVFVGGTVPLGYVKDDTGRLRPGPDAPLVREAFQMRAAGRSWRDVADWLADRTSGQWSVGAVRYMLKNRTYLGELNGGQGIVNLEGHEPLVDAATFAAAGLGRGIAYPRSGRASGLLSGVLRCASCRYALKPSLRSGGALDYRCKGGRRENASRCERSVSISAAQVHPFVVSEYFRHLGEYRALNVDNASEVRAAADALAEAEAERDAALDERLREILDTDAYMRVVGDRQAAVERARERLATAKRVDTLPDIDLEALWPDMSMVKQRHALAASLDAVFVRRGKRGVENRLHFCWAGSGVDLPTRGVRWTPKPFEFPG